MESQASRPDLSQASRRSIKSRVSRSLCSGGLSLAFAVVLGLMFSFSAGQAAAQQRTHQVSWGHPAPNEVSHFVVLVSPVEGAVPATREINVGMPEAQLVGALSLFSALISFEQDEFLAIAAIGHDGQMSTASNWSGMPLSRPGQPLLVEP